jgi:hypothetical protein
MAKDKKKSSLLNAFASLVDPELRHLGERLVSTIPEDSWLRSEVAERLFGALKGWIESKASGLGSVGGTLVEKFSDLLDFSSSDLFGHRKREGKTKVVSDWMTSFFKHAEKQLSQCDSKEKIEAEAIRLCAEFQARKEVADLIEQTIRALHPEEPKPTTPPINWERQFNKLMKKLMDKMKGVAKHVGAGVEKLADQATPHVKNFADLLETKKGGKR